MQPLPNTQTTSQTVSGAVPDDERHTRFLSKMAGHDKAFRIPVKVTQADGKVVEIDKKYVQADQGSDMNDVSTGLAKTLKLDLHSPAEVGFKGLSMRTADHRETILKPIGGRDKEGYTLFRCFGSPCHNERRE